MRERVEWIDTYRGILILFVVLNHQSLFYGATINDALSAIRMPAFFLISGFLLSDRYSDIKEFSYRRFRQLLVPYFIFFTLNWLFWAVALSPKDASIFDPLLSMLYGCVNTPGGEQNINAGPLWFITALFVAEIYMFFIKSFFKSSKKILFVTVILAFIGYLTSVLFSFRLPWNMEVALTALLFYALGYIIKKENFLAILPDNRVYLLTIVIVGLLIALPLSLSSMPNYATNNLGSNPIYTYISAIFGSISLIGIAKLINRNRLLEALGRNTYIILAFHLSALYLLHGVFKRVVTDFDATMNSDIWGVVYFIVSLLLVIPIIYIVNRFMPSILYRS